MKIEHFVKKPVKWKIYLVKKLNFSFDL
jgi:hypothetical protein